MKALTLDKQTLLSHPWNHQNNILTPEKPFDLRSLNYTLSDRPACETDFTRLQLIPYITLRDFKTYQVFTYQRGKGSAEDRLKGLYSIGLGGHIETEPTASYSIYDVLVDEIFRELDEEVGLQQTDRLSQTLYMLLSESRYKLIYATAREVDQVHLGIWLTLMIDADQLNDHEHGVITRSNWFDVSQLKLLSLNSRQSLETWSVSVLSYL